MDCFLIPAGAPPAPPLPPPAAAPPPPPPPPGSEPVPPSLSPPSVNGVGRGALLSSIQSFNKGKLKKSDTVDRSIPRLWKKKKKMLIFVLVQFVHSKSFSNLRLAVKSDCLYLDFFDVCFIHI